MELIEATENLALSADFPLQKEHDLSRIMLDNEQIKCKLETKNNSNNCMVTNEYC